MAMRRLKLAAAVAAFVCIAGVSGYQSLAHRDATDESQYGYWGLQDFRALGYYPALAFRQGVNPYDVEWFLSAYPARVPFLLYSPSTLLLHMPFSFLEAETADVVDFCVNAALILGLAALALQLCGLRTSAFGVMALAAVVLLTRPAQSALHLGQCTAYLAVATYVALHQARRRPWLAAIGLAVLGMKATYVVPLALLMWWRGDRRALAWGLPAAALLAFIPVPFLIRDAGGAAAFSQSLLHNFAHARGDSFNFDVALSPARVDAAAVLGHLLRRNLSAVTEVGVMLGTLAIAGSAIVRVMRERSNEAWRTAGAIACTAVLVCAYHQTYDLLLLLFPAVALAAGRMPLFGRRTFDARRVAILALLLVPVLNYLGSSTVMERIGVPSYGAVWLMLTTLNGAALLLALALQVITVLARVRPAVAGVAQPLASGCELAEEAQ